MLRFLSRFLGLWLLAGALVAVVVDGAQSIASAEVRWTPIAGLWQHVSPASLEAARLAVERSAPDWVWDPVLASILWLPAFAVFVALGALLLWVGQKVEPALPEFDAT